MRNFPEDTKEILRSYAHTPRKKMGQHFLVNQDLLTCLLDTAEILQGETVLEIGGGIGTLTHQLAERAKKVVVFEKDPRLGVILTRGLLPFFDNVEVITADFLQSKLPDFDVMVSNLPYNLATPITFKVLDEAPNMKRLVATYQKEAAQRICSSPGSRSYGRLTVALSYRASFTLIKTFSPKAFFPSPEVYSTVVKGNPKKTPDFCHHTRFKEFLECIFTRKNRKIRNLLQNWLERQPEFNTFDQKELKSFIDSQKLSEERAVRLTPTQIKDLYFALISPE